MKELIINIAKVISAIAVIGGAALWFDARFDNQADSNEAMIDSLEVVKRDISYNSIHLSQIDADIQGIQDTLDDFEREHKAQGQKINSLVWGVKNIERFTPEDFEDVIDEMLRRNGEVKPMTLPEPLGVYRGDVEFIPIN